MKFICDDNLGKLAKYLRILGFDTYFDSEINDSELLRRASAEQRLLITRNHHLASMSHPYGFMLVEYDNPFDQLHNVITSLSLKIDTALLFNRCSRCNELCVIVDKSKIAHRIFPFIRKTQEIIKQCPSCQRFYWKGSHYRNLLADFRKYIPDDNIIGQWPEIKRPTDF